MTALEAIVLGIVQGLTEFLPISSTAHLRIVPALLGWQDPGASFSAVIQLGTIGSVLLYFRRDLLRILRAVLQGLIARAPLGTPESRLGWAIAAGTVPIVLVGLTFQRWIKHELRSLWVIAGALVVVGVIMLIADRVALRRAASATAAADDSLATRVTFADAIWIGLAQACALVPGVSRSGSTIAAGLFRGLSRADAARFSFLLSIPAITGAGLKELLSVVREGGFAQTPWLPLALGTAVSFAVGYAAIAGLIAFLQRRSVLVFVVYRLLLAAVLAALVASGTIPAT